MAMVPFPLLTLTFGAPLLVPSLFFPFTFSIFWFCFIPPKRWYEVLAWVQTYYYIGIASHLWTEMGLFWNFGKFWDYTAAAGSG